MRENMIPGKSNDPGTGKCIVFVHLLNDFVMPCSVDPQKSLAEQILDMENVCGQFPKDKYFVHRGKTVVLDKPLQEQGIVGDCNIKVLLRLRGGGGKEGAAKREQSGNAPQTNETELQDLSTKLNNVTDGKPEDIEVEVRALFSEINSLEDTYDKKKLLTKLTAVAIRGLQEDLQNLLKEHGLSDKALQLVCDNTTRQIDLARKLYQAQKYGTKQDESYIVLSEKLLPKLETLGALVTNDIEVESQNGWVEQLIKISPSLTRLRRMNYSDLDNLMKGATNGDRSVVENLFAEGSEIRKQCQRYGIGLKTAEKLERKGVESASDMSKEQLDEIIEEAGKEEKPSTLKKMYFNESSERATERKWQDEEIKRNKEKIEEAKEIAKEARKITQEASEKSKKALQEKMKEIADKLSLPEGWDKQDKDDPNALLEQLNREINSASVSLERTPYVTNEAIAAAASGGLALYGILFDGNNIEGFSESPPFPLLKKPEYVVWLSPALGFEFGFFESTEQQASTKFYKTVKSSGLSIAASVTGSGWGFHASASGAHSSQSNQDTSTKKQEITTHATVTKYICQPTKAFRIPLEDMKLNYEARSLAKEIKDNESAEKFLKMYGSHVPKGVHTLGGVFFHNLEVNTEREASVSEVMMAAGKQFDTEVSAGYSGAGFSVGGSVKTGSFDISGSTDASSTEKVKFMSKMTVQALGPPTTNPEMFSQLLQSNNATWYVIDRGNRAALVPVWELMADLKEQAEILKEVWKGIPEKRAKEKAEILRKERQEKRTEVLDLPIAEMTVDMRRFSLALRSLYEGKSVVDETRKDAMVYLKSILPLSTQFLASISEFFEYYEALDYEEWCDMLSDILRETERYQQLCVTLLKNHDDFLIPIKRRKQNEALYNFIKGINLAAVLFSTMEKELKRLENIAEKAKDNPKRLYYKVMAKQAKDMKAVCQIFYAVLPDVRTGFLSIST